MRKLHIVSALLVGAFLAAFASSWAVVQAEEKSVALTPVPREGWWMERHEQKLKQKADMDQVDLVMIGDSITHGWEGRGKETWAKYYADRNALNLGYSGDRTEHVLWRLDNGEVDDIDPKLFTIMIGTNNIGHGSSTPAQTVEGVDAIIAKLRDKFPKAKVLLLAVFPRDADENGAKRKLVNEINAGLEKLEVIDGETVVYLDINEVFLEDDGVLPKSIMPDLLHPHEEGYKLWAAAVEPTLAKMFGDEEKK